MAIRPCDFLLLLNMRKVAEAIPRTDRAMPMIKAGSIHQGSPGVGQATIPRKKTLTIDVK